MSRLFRDVDGGPLCPHGSVVCIGAFDGLHLGHRALVRHAVTRARALGVPAVVVTFEPLPREFFAKDNPPPRLTLARAKVEGLLDLGADHVGLLRFDAKLSAMTAEDFARILLARRLGAKEVWIGPEFRFGHRRDGDLALLQALGGQLGFIAGEIEPVHAHGNRVSSTRIREALKAATSTPPRACSAGRTPSAAVSCAASSSAARSGFPPPTCASPRRPRCPASTPPGYTAWATSRGRRCPASVRGRRWRVWSRCWKRTCSISPATSTGATSMSNSSPSCATN